MGKPNRGSSDLPFTGSTTAITTRFGLVLALVVTYLVYSSANRFGFVYDDAFQIANNPRLDSWKFIPGYFTQHVWAQFSAISANLYRPLFLLWLYLNNQMFQHETTGWHVTSLLVHLIATGLSFLLARRLIRHDAAALFCATLFGLHPIHVEAVAWVSGVTEPLCACFFFGSFLLYLKSKESASGHGLLVASVTCFAAALLIKETAAVLPIVLFSYEVLWPEAGSQSLPSRQSMPTKLRRLIPYCGVLISYLAVRALVLHGLAHRPSAAPLMEALLTLPCAIWFYFHSLIWPQGLSPLYDVDYVTGILQARFVAPFLGLVVITAALWWWTGKTASRIPGFATAWFLLTLAPALAALLISPRYEGLNDRYLYLPSFGFCLVCGYLVGELASLVPKTAVMALATLSLAAMAVVTNADTRFWESDYTLFQHAAAVAPRNVTAKLNFATELIKHREYDRALQNSKDALALEPGSSRAAAACGQSAYFLHDYGTAQKYFALAAQLDPSRAESYRWLAMSDINLNHYDQAEAALREGIALSPKLAGMHYTLGKVISWAGDWVGARQQFEAELALDPQNHAAQEALQQAVKHIGEQSRIRLQNARLPSPAPGSSQN